MARKKSTVEVRIDENGSVRDNKGNLLVDNGELDDLTKAFLDAWNSGKETK